MRQSLRMFAAMILMASSVAAHAGQTEYDPAKVSDSLKAVFKFGSVSTTKALNANTVTLLSGTIGGTYVQFGADLASVLDDGGNLRVLPIIGRGSVQSVADILFLKGVDLGIVRTDTLDYLEKKGFANDIKKRFTYVTKLYNEEMQVVAPKTIKTLNDLEGKTVSVDLPNGGTFVTALTVFERLGIKANFVYIEQRIAMEKLKKGDLDAVIVVGGKPYLSVTTFNNDGRFHLAAVDYSKPLQSDYLPATLTSKDYPNLIAEGETVDTIAVPSVLAVYNWPPNTERSRKLALFVDAFFTKFAALQNPPFHPKWKEVSLSAPLAGWNRLPLAQQWLDKHGVEPLKRRFEAFQQENPAAANIKSEADKEAPFRQFQAWDARAQFQAWDARAQMGSEVDSDKVRDRDQSATRAAPPRDPPRRSHLARRALGRLIEQGAVTEAFQQENPAAANIKSEADKEALLQFQAWDARAPFQAWDARAQFQAWDARAQMGSEVDSDKVRDRDQSATQAAPPRDPPRRSRALGRLIEQGAVTEAFQQENPAAANIKSEADKEALLQFQAWDARAPFQAWDARAQFQAWDARAQMGSEVDSDKVRDRDQSATRAAPPRDPPRRSHLARRALGRLIEQGAVTGCEHQGHHRDRADPDGCNRASEEAWGNPFPSATPPPGATQGISTTDHPSSDFPERQYVFR